MACTQPLVQELLGELIRTTPHFREQVDQLGDDVDDMATTMVALSTAVDRFKDTSQAHQEATLEFSQALNDASYVFNLPSVSNTAQNPLLKFSSVLEQLASYHDVLVKQTEAVSDLVRAKVAEFEAAREAREDLSITSTKMWQSMSKFCACQFDGPTTKWDQLSRRGEKAFSARQLVQQLYLDHLHQIRELQTSSQIDLLEKMHDQFSGLFSYFHHSSQVLNDLDAFNTELFQNIAQLRQQEQSVKVQASRRKARLEATIDKLNDEAIQSLQSIIPVQDDKEKGGKSWKQRAADLKRNLAHQVIRRSPKTKRKARTSAPVIGALATGQDEEDEDFCDELSVSEDPDVIEGYMFRKSSRHKTWTLDYYKIEDRHLVTVDENGARTQVSNLQLSSVRPVVPEQQTGPSRFFCFELITPTSSVLLQTLGVREYQAWTTALQAGIAGALGKGPMAQKPNDARKQEDASDPATILGQVDGNDQCADCGASNTEWASINLGILLCIKCSGSHRALGVSYSKVRSLILDRWSTETLQFMTSVGNTKANNVYEARLPDFVGVKRPTADTPKDERDRFACMKYIDKMFVMDDEVPLAQPANGNDADVARAGPPIDGFEGQGAPVRQLRRPPPPPFAKPRKMSSALSSEAIAMLCADDGSSDEEEATATDFSAGLSPRVRESLRGARRGQRRPSTLSKLQPKPKPQTQPQPAARRRGRPGVAEAAARLTDHMALPPSQNASRLRSRSQSPGTPEAPRRQPRRNTSSGQDTSPSPSRQQQQQQPVPMPRRKSSREDQSSDVADA
eukprot:m.191767 g.191767  ORF g.191767 m.191767 type:complete len:793 (-) comp18252_c1_seq2:141-2519(-)